MSTFSSVALRWDARILQAAITFFDRAFESSPRMFAAGNNLAWILATNPDASIRDGMRAVEVAKKTCEMTGYKEYRLFSTLAAAYAESGDFAKAMEITQKAIQMASENNDQKTVDAMKERQIQFKSGSPVRD